MFPKYEVLEQVQQRIIVSFDEDLDVVREKISNVLFHGGAPEISEDKTWSEAVDYVKNKTRFGMILYRERDVGSVMKKAGATRRCHYLMVGNFTQVSEAYKADPSIFTVAPFHWCLYEDPQGVAKLAFDRPRRLFDQWDQPEIRRAGVEFDHKTAALLEYLGAQVPNILRED